MPKELARKTNISEICYVTKSLIESRGEFRKAGDSNPTRDCVVEAINNSNSVVNKSNESHDLWVKEFYDWVENNQTNTFTQKVFLIVGEYTGADDTHEKREFKVWEISFLVASIATYIKQKEGAEEITKMHMNSVWVGKIGERQEFFIKLVKLKTTSNYVAHYFTDEFGNIFVIYKIDCMPIDIDDCVVIKATIKDHRGKSSKHTVINRPKILENLGKKKENA